MAVVEFIDRSSDSTSLASACMGIGGVVKEGRHTYMEERLRN
jgi:hypothetical protein